MVKILSKQRAKPFKVHRGRAPKHLRKIEAPVSKLYGSLGLASSSNRKVSADLGQEAPGNPEPAAPVAKPDYRAEGARLWEGGAERPTVQQLREGAFDLPLSEPIEREGLQRTLFSSVSVTTVGDSERELVERLMARYGEGAEDYALMARDIELNRFQFPPGQIRRMFVRYRRAKEGPVLRPANRILLDRAAPGAGEGGARPGEPGLGESNSSGPRPPEAEPAGPALPPAQAEAPLPAPARPARQARRRAREGAPVEPQPVECMSIEEAQALARIFRAE